MGPMACEDPRLWSPGCQASGLCPRSPGPSCSGVREELETQAGQLRGRRAGQHPHKASDDRKKVLYKG